MNTNRGVLSVARTSGDECAAAVAASLAPYAWRSFTVRMLARCVVGAVDRHRVLCFLGTLPGTDVGVVDAPEPAQAGDDRVDFLVGELEGRSWRQWSLGCLCSHLLTALEAWRLNRDSLHLGLRRLLEEH
jgi:hypothetical protein